MGGGDSAWGRTFSEPRTILTLTCRTQRGNAAVNATVVHLEDCEVYNQTSEDFRGGWAFRCAEGRIRVQTGKSKEGTNKAGRLIWHALKKGCGERDLGQAQ